MNILNKLKSFASLPWRAKKLLCKAVMISAVVKTVLVFFPFRIVLKWLGKINVESLNISNENSLATRAEIKHVMMLCNKYTFWETECYTLSLTCKILLKEYNLPSTIYIGFYKNEEGKYCGHAWLRSLDMILTGEEEHNKYNVQSFFS